MLGAPGAVEQQERRGARLDTGNEEVMVRKHCAWSNDRWKRHDTDACILRHDARTIHPQSADRRSFPASKVAAACGRRAGISCGLSVQQIVKRQDTSQRADLLVETFSPEQVSHGTVRADDAKRD
jgi:hypothetical protein